MYHLLLLLHRLAPQLNGKGEYAAHAVLTVHPYFSAHQTGQALTNGQAQTGTSVFTGYGYIGLRKGFEQILLLLLLQANSGVDYRKEQNQLPVLLLLHPYFNQDLPLIGKLDRKSTRLNSSHVRISYAVFCLKKKK